MTKKQGLDIELSEIKNAGQDIWWRQASSQGIEFAYLRFYDGLKQPTFSETSQLKNIGNFDRNQMPLGAYCLLDPDIDGEAQAHAFINYLTLKRGLTSSYTLASLYRLRPALWLTRDGDSSSVRHNALGWLKTVTRFMRNPPEGQEPIYQADPIFATTRDFAVKHDLAADPELRDFHLWIFDESQGRFPPKGVDPVYPKAFKPDLWHTRSNLDFGGQRCGFNLSVDLGKREKEPDKRFPIRKLTVIPLLLLGGAFYLANRFGKSKPEPSVPRRMGMYNPYED